MRNTTLKLAIVASGRPQAALAEALGIGETRMSRLVNGWSRPRREERRRIAEVLGREEDALFGVGAAVPSEPEHVGAGR